MERRKNLFTSKEEVPLLDDTGKSLGTTVATSIVISLTGEHNQDSMSSSNMPVQVRMSRGYCMVPAVPRV